MPVKLHMAGHPWTPEEKDLKRAYQTRFAGRTGFLADNADIVYGQWMCWVNWGNDEGTHAVFGDALVLDLPNMVDPSELGNDFRKQHMPQQLKDAAICKPLARDEDLEHLRKYEHIQDWNTVAEFCMLDSCQSKYFILPNGVKTLLSDYCYCLMEPHKDYMLHEDLLGDDIYVTRGSIVFRKDKHFYERLKVLRVILEPPTLNYSIEYTDPKTGKLSYADCMYLAASPYYSLVHSFVFVICSEIHLCMIYVCLVLVHDRVGA